MQAQDILNFWFEELTDKQHFAKDTALDEMIRRRFGRYPHRTAMQYSGAHQALTSWHF